MNLSDSGTKERLLSAATRVFADRGFKETTVREICALAGANLAAVNYHFGSKERLYNAVLGDFLSSAFSRFPMDVGVGPDSPPEDRLKAYIRGFLYRVLGDGDPLYEKLGKLLMAEILEPSEHFDTMSERYIGPTYEALQHIVADLLPGAGADVVHRCAGSVVGQCLLFDHAKGIIQRMCPELALEANSLGRAADFIADFSLGGIARLRAGGKARS
ncbi:MAG: CerR family C-terminal domain-containing protein [Deltaproteobacteria bacterium]|nr:CerR family C-terminal domain-containing protein [Deltaproteobacteria bacterium]